MGCRRAMTSTRPTLVVAGLGMVAHRLLATLAGRDTGWRLVGIGEEPRPAYDRVHLSSLFEGASADDLLLGDLAGVEVRTSERVTAVDRVARTVTTSAG